jgi:hypothetical protein
MTGPNPRNLYIVVALINVTNLLSFSFSWVDYAHDDLDFGPLIIGMILWFLTDLSLWKAAICDPGLLPRMTKDPHVGGHLENAFRNKAHLVLHGPRG